MGDLSMLTDVVGAAGAGAARHNDALSTQEFQRLFKIIDCNHSGMIQGRAVNKMFNAILGFDCGDQRSSSKFDINALKNVVNTAHASHPGWKVRTNLLKYISENQEKVHPDHDIHDDPLHSSNMQKLFRILDSDGSGVLDIGEAFKLFKAANLEPSLLMNKVNELGIVEFDFERFCSIIQQLEDERPEKNIDGKILHFLQEAMHKGKPVMEEVDLQNPDPPAEEEHPVGNKKAVLVGINYIGTENSLEGCIYDAENEMRMLCEHFGFPEDNIRVLTDDKGDKSQIPTKANMLTNMKWLMEGAKKGDVLYFHYSGHGSQVPDPTGEEEDGMNECLCPSDCLENEWPDAVIVDDFLNDTFFDGLPEGVRLTCVYDCCHSGTMTDLACVAGLDEEEEAPAGSDGAARGLGKSRVMTPPENVSAALQNQNALKQPKKKVPVADHRKYLWTVSGCQDNQTSADACIQGIKQGALTWSLHMALAHCKYDLTYEELLHMCRKKLKRRYTQIPSMSTTVPENFRCKFLGKGLAVA